MKKNVLRGLAGLAILAFGLMVMNALIGMKGTPPVKPRSASARLVKVMPARSADLAPKVSIEGRVLALNRMTVLSEVNGVLPWEERNSGKAWPTERTKPCCGWTIQN